MSLRKEQCNKVCHILDDVLANRPNERDSLVIATRKAFAGPQWIPCSERLPEARQSVILSTENWTGEGCYWETTEYHVIWKGYRWKATYWDDEVIAWMPLPEPYREEERDALN